MQDTENLSTPLIDVAASTGKLKGSGRGKNKDEGYLLGGNASFIAFQRKSGL